MLQQIKAQAKQRFGKEDGFTLMELLIVIAIIAVLVAIAIPVFSTQLDNAKDAADRANARAIYALAQAEWMDNANHEVKTNFEWDAGERKMRVHFDNETNGGTQAFSFSDRTSEVSVSFDDGRGATVQVDSSTNRGTFWYPES